MRHISIKNICIAVGAVLFSVLIIFSGIRVYHRWASVQYFGKIIELKDGGFLMQTDGGAEKIVETDSGTAILKGRRQAAGNLLTGDYVIVMGAATQEGAVKAEMIRIINAKPLSPR